MDNKRTDGSQSGRSMVEMLGVLAIIGVLSIGGIAGYSRAMIKFKVGKSLDQISMLVASIQTLYSGQRNYSGLTLKEAISYGVISPDMKASDFLRLPTFLPAACCSAKPNTAKPPAPPFRLYITDLGRKPA